MLEKANKMELILSYLNEFQILGAANEKEEDKSATPPTSLSTVPIVDVGAEKKVNIALCLFC